MRACRKVLQKISQDMHSHMHHCAVPFMNQMPQASGAAYSANNSRLITASVIMPNRLFAITVNVTEAQAMTIMDYTRTEVFGCQLCLGQAEIHQAGELGAKVRSALIFAGIVDSTMMKALIQFIWLLFDRATQNELAMQVQFRNPGICDEARVSVRGMARSCIQFPIASDT